MGKACDVCDGDVYTPENPRVMLCQRRPSDPSDLCCTMAGHWWCFGTPGRAYVPFLPTVANGGDQALATGDDLERWIEGPDAKALGYVFLT